MWYSAANDSMNAFSPRLSRRGTPDARPPVLGHLDRLSQKTFSGGWPGRERMGSTCGSDGERPGRSLLSGVRAISGRELHGGRARAAPPPLHEPRPARVRARQPARDGQGGAVRALFALPRDAPAAVPRGVRRRSPATRRRCTTRARASAPLSCTSASSSATATTRWRNSGGAHVACEWVSNVLTKILQRPRLAGYLEQSTRYIAYDAPMPGRIPPAAATATTATRRSAPPTSTRWTSCSGSTRPRSRGSAPGRSGSSRGPATSPTAAHARAIKAKALDLLRGLLPASSLSHMGIFATGQTYEQLILHLLAHPLEEARSYGRMILDELRAVMPSFLTPRRAPRPRRPVDQLSRVARARRRAVGEAARHRCGRRRPRRARRSRSCASMGTRTICSRRCCSRPAPHPRSRSARRSARSTPTRAPSCSPTSPASARTAAIAPDAASRRSATGSRSSRTTARSATSSATGCSPCSGSR